METVDELLASYKKINDQLAKNNELNEKIFREMTLTKVRKSLSILGYIDILGILCFIIAIPYFSYAVYKCSDRIDMLIASITFLILMISYIFYFYKSLKGKIFASWLLNENDLKDSIQSIQAYRANLVFQQKVSISIVPVIFLFEIPIAWYTQFHMYYLDMIQWHLQNNPSYLILLICLLIGATIFAWKMYDWVNFPILNRIEKNLQELEEK